MAGVDKAPAMIVSKTFSFHAAHQLHNHDGQCARLHGHTYILEIRVLGIPRAADDTSGEGMVIDFGVLKDLYKRHVEPHVEHQNLNETLGSRVGPTTCENMARFFARYIREELRAMLTEEDHGRRVRLHSIKLWETPTSSAEVLA